MPNIKPLGKETWGASMNVIPVIDLKDGAVVRARLGRREYYAPIVTPLASTSRPVDVVAGFLSLYPFSIIYIADIDAIEGRGDHKDVLDVLDATFPAVTFWVDAGVRDAGEARTWLLRHQRAELVLGTETMTSFATLEILRDESRLILSLDFRGEALLGPESLLDAPHLWPPRVIVLTLTRVGTNAGPDISRAAAIKASSSSQVYAGGGVRDLRDLETLRRAGVDGALIASAFHDGQLTAKDLAPAMASY